MIPPDSTTAPPPKRRLVILGYFSGTQNKAKRDFFLDHDRWREVFDEICILDAGKDTPASGAGLTWIRFPVWLFKTAPHPWWILQGLYRILVVGCRNRRLLREVLTLEWLVAFDVGGSFLQWIAKTLYFPIGFVNGLGRTYLTIDKLNLGKEDYVMLWSEHFSASRIFKQELLRLGPKFFIQSLENFRDLS